MQVARNSFLVKMRCGRTLRRKLIELRLTRLIEGELTKDQILELYLNLIYLGNGMNGVEAASRDLFGKSVAKLSIDRGRGARRAAQGARAPTRRATTPSARCRRRNLVLSLMAQEGYLTPGEAAPPRRSAAAHRRGRVAPRHGERAARARRRARLHRLDPARRAQGGRRHRLHDARPRPRSSAADRAVLRQAAVVSARDAVRRRPRHRAGAGRARRDRSAHGDIRALVGGRRSKKGFNRAFNARRQPGSAFKPFVYAAALAAGMTPATLVDDEPVEVAQGRTVWRPANYDGSYIGTITLAKALAVSSNAAAVRVSQTVGIPSVIAGGAAQRHLESAAELSRHRARRRGRHAARARRGVRAVREWRPARAPAARASHRSGGRHGALERGDRARRHRDGPARRVSAHVDAAGRRGQRNRAHDSRHGREGPVAGKTGTTNNAADVWFVGYTPTLVAGVWFGYDTPRADRTARIGRTSRRAGVGRLLSQWLARAGVIGERVDDRRRHDDAPDRSRHGMLANEWCPMKKREYFKPGTEPTEVCNVHTEPVYQEQEGPSDMGPPAPDPIRRGVDGIGKVLRKIFRF